MKDFKIIVNSKEDTKRFAEKLAKNLEGGEIICLIGDLGAGKTYFTKYLAEALGIDPENIISPTFIYWRKHKGKKLNLNHFDFYRIDEESEAGGIGFEEAVEDEDAVTVIEWADKIKSLLPEERIEIYIEELEKEKRKFEVKMIGERYKKLL